MPKSPDAFRTISEVADWLGIQAHVLRFWESKFTQVKPIKRAGGRRYYRPTDMSLLGGIKKLLHDDGLTIKGVQKILREEGMSHVSALSPPLDDEDEIDGVVATATPVAEPTLAVVEPEEEKGVVLPFDAPVEDDEHLQRNIFEEDDFDEVPEVAAADTSAEPEPVMADVEAPVEAAPEPPVEAAAPEPEAATASQPAVEAPTKIEPEPFVDVEQQAEPEPVLEAKPEPEIAATPEPAQEPEPLADPAPAAEPHIELDPFVDPAALAAASNREPDPVSAQAEAEPAPAHDAAPSIPEASDAAAEAPAPAGALPAFLRRPLVEPEDSAPKDNAPAVEPEPVATAPEPAAAPAPKPRIVEVPEAQPEATYPAAPAGLTAAYKAKALSKAQGAEAAPLLAQLTALRDSMAARRRNPPGPAASD